MWRLIWLGWLLRGPKHLQLAIKLTALLSKWKPKSTKAFYEYWSVQGKTIYFLSLVKNRFIYLCKIFHNEYFFLLIIDYWDLYMSNELLLNKQSVLHPHKEDHISQLRRHRLINLLPLPVWKLLLNKQDILLLHWDQDFAIEWALLGEIIIGFLEPILNELFKINQLPMSDTWHLDYCVVFVWYFPLDTRCVFVVAIVILCIFSCIIAIKWGEWLFFLTLLSYKINAILYASKWMKV